jgi:tetratricopeptide (TPR) repeat protein
MHSIRSEAWKPYRRKSGQRYLVRYLAYAKAHNKALIEDYDKLEGENENLLAAVERAGILGNWGSLRELAWSLSANGEHGYLRVRGYWNALRRMLELAIEAAIQENEPGDWIAFRINLASLLIDVGEWKAAQEMYHLVLPVLESIQMNSLLSTVHHHLGQIEQRQGRFVDAATAYQRSLKFAEAEGDASRIAVVNHNLGTLAYLQGNYLESRMRYTVALEVWRESGDQESVAAVLHNLGMVEQIEGHYERAHEFYEQSLALEQTWDHKIGIAASLESLGSLAMATGDYLDVDRYYEASLKIRQAIGDQKGIAGLYHNQGYLAQQRGNSETARDLYQQSLSLKTRLGDQIGAARTRGQLGLLALEQGNLAEAETFLQGSLGVLHDENARAELANIHHQLGLVAQARGLQTTTLSTKTHFFQNAEHLYKQSLQEDEAMGNQAGIAKSLHQLGSLAAAEGKLENANQYFNKSLEIKFKLGDRAGIARTQSEIANLQVQLHGIPALQEAKQLLTQTIKQFQTLGEKGSVSQASLYLARLLVVEERLDEAQTVLDNAAAAYISEGQEEPQDITKERNKIKEKLSFSR